MNKRLVFSLAALALASSPVCAKLVSAERVAANFIGESSGCMTENATISVNFNGVEQDANTVKTKFDAKVAEIEALIKAAKLDKFEMQSMNYSISPQNYGNMSSMFQFNGSLGFNVLPSSKATELMAELTKKGYQASVNVNAYRNGNVPCQQTDKK